MKLPALPTHTVVVVDEHETRDPPGFLRLRRVHLKVRFDGGRESSALEYDTVDRARLDAVVMAAHYRDASGARSILAFSITRSGVFFTSVIISMKIDLMPRTTIYWPARLELLR